MKRTIAFFLTCLFVFVFTTRSSAQWTEQNNGLYGGIIRSSAVSVDGNTLYIGSPTQGVHKSTDSGSNWSQINTGLTEKSVEDIVVSGTSIFVGTNGAGGVFRSSNNGISWEQVGLSSLSVNSISVHGENIFAGTFSGLYLSIDNGANWTLINNGLSGTVNEVTGNETFTFAATSEGVFRSSDAGASWTQVSNGMPSSSITVLSLAFKGTDLYAGTYNSGILKSTDNGVNWTSVNTGLNSVSTLWVYSLAVSGSSIFAGSNFGVYQSTDDGANWSAVNTGLSNSFVTTLTIESSNLYAGTEGGGVYKTANNGGSWAETNTGIALADIRFLDKVGSNLFAGTNGAGLFQSSDEAITWTKANTGLTNFDVKSFVKAGSNLLLGTPDGVFMSNNNAAAWAITELSGIDVSSLVLNGTDVYAGSLTGVYRSTNNGVNWSSVSTGITDLGIKHMTADGTNIYASTSSGVFKSSDNGVNWAAINSGLTNTDVTFLLVKGSKIFASTVDDLFVSSDGGANWSITGFPDNHYATYLYLDDNTIYATSSNSTWASSDDGVTWTRPDDNTFPLTSFTTLVTTDTKVIVGSNTFGVLLRDIGEYNPPTITSFTPTNAGNGTTVTITGTNFSGASEVSFGGIMASSFDIVSETSIAAVVSTGASGSVSVTTPGGIATLAGFTFTLPPTISSFAPVSAGTGDAVTINGTKFTGVTSVSFGGTEAASFSILDDISISAVVGAGSSGSISVISPDGTASKSGFTYVSESEAPTIESFNPTSGSLGTEVIITGTNFSTTLTDNIIKFNGTSSAVTASSSTSITTSVPDGATTGKITVEVGSQIGTSTTDFEITTDTSPTISEFNPTSGPVGTEVVITGTNFDANTPANNTIQFNGTAATVTNVTSTTITTNVPNGAVTGKISIEVSNEPAESSDDFVVTVESATVEIVSESFVASYNQGESMTVSITVNDANSTSQVNFVTRGISEEIGSETSENVTVSSGTDTFEVTVNAGNLNDPIGLTYYFEITDNDQATITSSKGNAYLNFPSGTSTPALPSLSFGATISNYQIISIPYQLDDKKVSSIFDELMPYDKTLWRLFDFANGDNREYSGFSNIDIGKGYWIIARNSTTINPGSGSAPQVTEENPFSINLASGWNLIGNPYNFRISWTEVQNANGGSSIVGPLNTFSGGTLSESATLDKYRGGFVFNSGSPMSIDVPVTSSLGGRYASEEATADLGADHWELSLNLSQGSLHNLVGGIGMHPEATLVGKDQFDQVNVPMIDGMGFFELGFSHPEYKANFSREIVPSTAEYTWTMNINRDVEDKPIMLNWDNEDFGKNENQLFLFNPNTLETVDMRTISEYEINASSSQLQVFFGAKNYVDGQLEEVTPFLGDPYPNPTTHQISYPFRVANSELQEVTLKVFDNTGKLMGEREEKYSTGFHQLDWQFKRQGVFILQLQMGEVIKRNKIIVR